MTSLMQPHNAVEVLLERVPAFAAARALDYSHMSHDDSSPYLVFGDFAGFLRELIVHKLGAEDTSNILAESFRLLSEMATSPNDELANLAVVGVFEVLADSPESVAVARKQLSRKALKVFDRVLRGWI